MIITTPRTTLSHELQNALKQILDYLSTDDERSFEGEPNDNHIFHAVNIVRAWLSQTGEPATKFELGALFITVGAREELEFQEVITALARHARGDWGDVCEEDRQSNDFALGKFLRLFSVYRSEDNTKFWIITEADRSATTVLLPDEY
jgi:hypothetical protein